MLKTKNSDTMGYAARILLNMSEVNDICREIFLLDGLCPLVESFYVDILNRTNPQLTKIMNKSSLDLLTKTLFLLFKSPFVDADMHKYLNILNYLLCSHTPVHHIYQALADINFIDILLEIMKRFSDNHCIHTVCISLLSHFFLGQTPLIPWTTPLRATLSSFACNSDADLHLIQDCIIQQDRITGSRDPLNVP